MMTELISDGFSLSIMYEAKSSAKNESTKVEHFDERGEGMERSWGNDKRTIKGFHGLLNL